MSKRNDKVSISIDNSPFKVGSGLTILEAAEQNDVYIPTLCAHKELTPFGGCRMCIVEVEGMRGLPTACTTPVEEGMIIRTRTRQVQAERKEILQLILSEHTSSCLICEEKDECKGFMGTIRKAGVTTGCRYCPNDRACELQDVVEKMEIREIGYPVYYRNLRVEKDDPFYDRDYNLCILCGRCIRMCQEIRTANTLAFKQRGRYTVIGPAYERTHLEAGCEFCGACVSVCPTGALAEKVSKWEGKAEREQTTTCPFCGVGCQIRLQIRGDEVLGSLPEQDTLINDGQLCVKGRFCVAEVVNNHRRLRRPYRTQNNTRRELSWNEAIDLATERLSACSAEEFGMLISPNCSNEDLYIAQKFARVVMGSHNIDTSARWFYGTGLNGYLNLTQMAVPLSDLREASVILCLGLDTRFSRSVVGVELRKAIARGAKVLTINPRHHSLSVIAEKWIQPTSGTELSLIDSLVKLTPRKAKPSRASSKATIKGLSDELLAVAEMLKGASSPMILVGSEFLQHDESPQILESIKTLAQNTGAGVLPLPAQNNLFGSILMGTYPELLPGGFSSSSRKRLADLKKIWGLKIPGLPPAWEKKMFPVDKKLKVLYLVGEVPLDTLPESEFLIVQNIYPPDPWHAGDLALPAASFAEVDGTFINGEGRIQRVRKAVHPPGEALPDWEILCRIARKMGNKGFNFSSARKVHKEISSLVKGFGNFDKPSRKASPLTCEAELFIPRAKSKTMKTADKRFPLVLNTSVVEHTHRGFLLSTWVEGARELFPEGVLEVNSEDAKKAKISEGDEVVVTSANFEKTWPVRIVSEQPQGTMHVTLRQGESVGSNPHRVRIRKKNV
ncbi:MAG: molybdopterin-dependent oxidoreductase [Candidatus Zixiibacteriota bacterium]|nr:MAG: molybdopterin-dependent oxidoreductase [candidate division Zixibacteria bacterium]